VRKIKVKFKKVILSFLCFLMAFGLLAPNLASASSPYVSANISVVKSSAETAPVQKSGQGEVGTQNVITKHLIKQAARYGGTALGNLIKRIPYNWAQRAGDAVGRWSNQVVNVIDMFDNYTYAGVYTALINMGVPPSDAAYIAQFLVFFL
jgi:hypothetical protein